MRIDPIETIDGVIDALPSDIRDYRRLWAAVVHTAVRDAVKGAFRVEAYDWIMSDDMRAPGFRWCCDVLRLPVDRVRAKVNALRNEYDAERAARMATANVATATATEALAATATATTIKPQGEQQ